MFSRKVSHGLGNKTEYSLRTNALASSTEKGYQRWSIKERYLNTYHIWIHSHPLPVFFGAFLTRLQRTGKGWRQNKFFLRSKHGEQWGGNGSFVRNTERFSQRKTKSCSSKRWNSIWSSRSLSGQKCGRNSQSCLQTQGKRNGRTLSGTVCTYLCSGWYEYCNLIIAPGFEPIALLHCRAAKFFIFFNLKSILIAHFFSFKLLLVEIPGHNQRRFVALSVIMCVAWGINFTREFLIFMPVNTFRVIWDKASKPQWSECDLMFGWLAYIARLFL